MLVHLKATASARAGLPLPLGHGWPLAVQGHGILTQDMNLHNDIHTGREWSGEREGKMPCTAICTAWQRCVTTSHRRETDADARTIAVGVEDAALQSVDCWVSRAPGTPDHGWPGACRCARRRIGEFSATRCREWPREQTCREMRVAGTARARAECEALSSNLRLLNHTQTWWRRRHRLMQVPGASFGASLFGPPDCTPPGLSWRCVAIDARSATGTHRRDNAATEGADQRSRYAQMALSGQDGHALCCQCRAVLVTRAARTH